MIEYLALIIAIPIGLLLHRITHDEKEIYSKAPYFPVLLWILAIASVITYSINKQTALTLTFLLITTFVWNKTN